MGNRKPFYKWLILTLSATLIVAGLTGCGEEAEETNPSQDLPGNVTEGPTEEPNVALPTRYIVLSYPAEIKEDVKVSYEDLKDGQKIIFTTDFTGESLELFRFVISKTVTEGHQLGVLEDAQAGSLAVCVSVQEYLSGNWEIEDYNKLISLQERVNDIMAQIQEDPRFVPNQP